jgi:hypothetical protein
LSEVGRHVDPSLLSLVACTEVHLNVVLERIRRVRVGNGV